MTGPTPYRNRAQIFVRFRLYGHGVIASNCLGLRQMLGHYRFRFALHPAALARSNGRMATRFQFSLRALLAWSIIPAIFYAGMLVRWRLDERETSQLTGQVKFYENLILDYERQLQFLTGKLEMQHGEIESLRATLPAKPEIQD